MPTCLNKSKVLLFQQWILQHLYGTNQISKYKHFVYYFFGDKLQCFINEPTSVTLNDLLFFLFACCTYLSIDIAYLFQLLWPAQCKHENIYINQYRILLDTFVKGVVVHVNVIQMTYKSRTHYPIVKKPKGTQILGKGSTHWNT